MENYTLAHMLIETYKQVADWIWPSGHGLLTPL